MVKNILIRRMHTHSSRIFVPIYVDGSYELCKNGFGKGIGGIGVFFPNGMHKPIAEPYKLWFPDVSPTSFRCELLAIYRAMAISIFANQPATIYSDSQSALHVIQTGKNVNGCDDILLDLHYAYNQRRSLIQFQHVSAHTYTGSQHSVGNAIADILAKYGRKLN